MSDVFLLLLCLVLLSLTLAIAVRLGDTSLVSYSEGLDRLEGFEGIPPVAVTAQLAYEQSEQNGTGPTRTGSYEQKTSNPKRTSARTGQIMERELINPPFET